MKVRVRNIVDVVHLRVEIKYIVRQEPNGDSTMLYEVSGDIKRGQTELSVESGVSVDEVVEIVKPYNFIPFNPIGRNLRVTDEQIYNMQVDCNYVPNTDIGADEVKQRRADIDGVMAFYPPLIDEMFEEDYPEKPIAKEVSIQNYKQAHRILESEWYALDSKLASFSANQLNTGYRVEECAEEKAKQILKCAIY